MVKPLNDLWLCRDKKDELLDWLARCGYDTTTKIAKELAKKRLYGTVNETQKHLEAFLEGDEPLPGRALSAFAKMVEYNSFIAGYFVSRTQAYSLAKQGVYLGADRNLDVAFLCIDFVREQMCLDADGEQRKRDNLLKTAFEEINRIYQTAPDKARDIVLNGLEKVINSFG